jgi:hypothetical protein
MLSDVQHRSRRSRWAMFDIYLAHESYIYLAHESFIDILGHYLGPDGPDFIIETE